MGIDMTSERPALFDANHLRSGAIALILFAIAAALVLGFLALDSQTRFTDAASGTAKVEYIDG